MRLSSDTRAGTSALKQNERAHDQPIRNELKVSFAFRNELMTLALVPHEKGASLVERLLESSKEERGK